MILETVKAITVKSMIVDPPNSKCIKFNCDSAAATRGGYRGDMGGRCPPLALKKIAR